MPETTTNYGLKKPLPNEHYDIAVQNENMDTIDAVLAGKLDKTGAGSDVTVEFIQASSRANIASGEKLSILFGKLRKWFADLKTVAWTGSYSDLTDKPAIPAALADLNEDSMHRTVTDAEKAAWNAKSNLALGETATTAYRGDRGKIAYDHSQTTGNPHSTTPADIGAAAAVHTHSNLSVNGKALTGAVTLSASDVGAAAASHAHGNISSDGKIGSTANRAIYTGTNGVLQAGTLPISAGGTGATSAASALSSLGAVPASRKVNGKALTSDISITAADIGVERSGVWKLLASYTTAGTFTWTAPDYYGDGQPYEIGVYMIGGGGSGGAAKTNLSCYAVGGAAGYGKNITLTVTPNQTYSGVVGAGGASVNSTSGSTGKNGGSTSFAGYSVNGGQGGKATFNGPRCAGADGGQGSTAQDSDVTVSPCGCAPAAPSSDGTKRGGTSQSPKEGQNAFDPIMITLAAGGGANHFRGQTGASVTGGKGGDGTVVESGSATGGSATGYGNGGGAAIAHHDGSGSATSGAGSDGAVFIYVRGLVE